MFYITIDCGTTNSRAYVVDETGKIFGKATKQVGVKDTAQTGSRDKLRAGLKEIVAEAIRLSGVSKDEIGAVLSSGMITSEIGLCEIPHHMAPCSAKDLAGSITRLDDTGIIEGVPVYFVRGIKNNMSDKGMRPSAQVGELDFMRGEEVQLAGIMARPDVKLPATVVILSSHTKFNAIDEKGTILGSLTTMSGQTRAAVLENTFVGKSVEKRDNIEEEPAGYFDEDIVRDAANWIKEVGLLRSLMFPRFLDVLLDTKWYERRLFYDALIAADDMQAIQQMKMFTASPSNNYYLVGHPDRCKLYDFVLKEIDPKAEVISITDVTEIDELSIQGILMIAREGGIVK